MKNQKKNSEDLVSKHVVVTKEVFNALWALRVYWKCKRLNDVILYLIQGDT